MKPRLAALLPWGLIASVIAISDQVTKVVVEAWLVPGEVVRVTGFFNVVLAYNSGAAFSFLAGAGGWQRWFFVLVASIATVVIAWLLSRHRNETLFCAGLSLILGGAVGNLWDRILIGHVVDFLDFHAAGWHWPAFNVADSAISVGAALLILDGFRNKSARS